MRGDGSGSDLFVVLLPTLECNLACSYCFEQHPSGRWSDAETRHVLEQVFRLATARGAGRLQLHWQGGEALLLGADYWQGALSDARERAEKCGIELSQSLQSNLTRYSHDFASLVHEYCDGKLGTSFDDTTARRFPDGEPGRFPEVWQRAFGRAQRDGIEVGVLSLLSDDALARGAVAQLEVLRERHGIRRLRFTLPFRGDRGQGYWLDPVKAGRFLCDAYTTWVARGRERYLELRPFAFLESSLAARPTDEPGLCVFAPLCADGGLSIGPNGVVTLCDSLFSSERVAPYGNVFESSLLEIFQGSAHREARGRCRSLLNRRCLRCRYLSLCFGGCLVRSRPMGRPRKLRFHYCQSHRMLLSCIESELWKRRSIFPSERCPKGAPIGSTSQTR